jgi:hypothetical protein
LKTWIIHSGGEAGNMSISEFDGTEEITYIWDKLSVGMMVLQGMGLVTTPPVV